MSHPPRLARALLARLLPRASAEFVLGDLDELYARRAGRMGRVRAHAWYWRASLRLLLERPRRHTDQRVLGGMTGLSLDARSAARSLRRTPAFTLIASGTLALGLGVTIAVYAMADQLMMRPPPGVHDAERAVYIEFVDPEDASATYLSPTDLEDFRAATMGLVEQLTAATWIPVHLSVDRRDPITAQVGFIDGPWFELLGVRAAMGRLPSGSELTVEAPMIGVISERLWSTLFTRDPDVVGATVRLNGRMVTIVGVAADGFAGLERDTPIDVWVPVSAAIPVIGFERERLISRRAALYSLLVARLRPGVGEQAALAGMQAAAAGIVNSLPEGESTLAGRVPRLHTGLHIPPEARTRTRDSLRILAAIVTLVLLVSCANVANLLLFRALRSRHELVIRRALGASRVRIVVQQMMGNALLTLLALLAALGVAGAITQLFAGRKLLGMPAFDSLGLDGRLLLFAGAAAVVAAVLAGALPAWAASRSSRTVSPVSGVGLRTTGRHERLRRAMTVIQLTASLALIVAALLLMRTVRTLYSVDPGYAVAGVYVVRLNFPASYDAGTREAAFMRAEAAVATVPGIDGFAFDYGGPLVSRLRGPVVRAGPDVADRTFGIVTAVTPEWFDVMDVRVLRGRPFNVEDRGPVGQNHVILSEGLAHTLFGTDDPIGRRIHAFGRSHEVEVIGVAEDIRYGRILADPEPMVYHSWSLNTFMSSTVLLYRTPRRGAVTANAVRSALARAVPQLAVETPVPLTGRLDEQLADHRLFAQLLGLLSVLAAVLAGVGLYAVVGYGVADRAREFGIRVALGAPVAGIARLVLRQTALTFVIGTLLGLAAAHLLARVIAQRLEGVSALDPVTYLLAMLALAGIGAAACVAPVRSATKADPMAVLRED